MEPILTKITRELLDKYGRDVAMAVTSACYVARDKWSEEDTKKYGTIAAENLPKLFD